MTEQELAKLGYKETLIFRPAALTEGKRADHRLAESILMYGQPHYVNQTSLIIMLQKRYESDQFLEKQLHNRGNAKVIKLSAIP